MSACLGGGKEKKREKSKRGERKGERKGGEARRGRDDEGTARDLVIFIDSISRLRYRWTVSSAREGNESSGVYSRRTDRLSGGAAVFRGREQPHDMRTHHLALEAL